MYNIEETELKQTKWIVAVYVRLSDEDMNKIDESNSVINQRSMIVDFVKKHDDFIVHDFYIDDGYTGTNFERPAFERMIRDMKKGFFNCIIVKDTSRLGRDYIEHGNYVEKIFPQYNIRYIALNDGYDSFLKTNCDFMPVKAVFNDFYCADISKKVRSAKETMARAGKYYGSFPPYGYLKDPNDKHKLIIDENVSHVVKKVYDLYIECNGIPEVAKRLNKLGIIPPSDYFRSIGYNFKNVHGTKPEWGRSQIRNIIDNDVYIGHLTQHKSKKVSHKIKNKKVLDKNEHITVKNTHEAIIDMETWNKVRELRKLKTRVSKNTKTDAAPIHIFAGLLKCGNCNRGIMRKYATSSSKENAKIYYYLKCRTKQFYNEESCINDSSMREDVLVDIILQDIKKEISLGLMANDITEIINAKTKNAQKRKSLNVEIQKYEERKLELYKLTKGITEKNVLGKLSDELFESYKKEYELEEQDINRKLESIREEKNKENNKIDTHNIWINKVKRYANIDELNRDIVTDLIERITLYKDKVVEIKYKHRSEFLDILKEIYKNSCTYEQGHWSACSDVQLMVNHILSLLPSIKEELLKAA